MVEHGYYSCDTLQASAQDTQAGEQGRKPRGRKQQITGPYQVKPGGKGYEVVHEIAQGKLQPLDPPVSYKHRQNAFRAMARLNRQWQARQARESEAIPCS